MPKGQRSQEQKDLEDQLRNMILGNVRISSDNAHQNQTARGQGRGRGPGSQYMPPHLRHASNSNGLGMPTIATPNLTSPTSPAYATNSQYSAQHSGPSSPYGFENHQQQMPGRGQGYRGRGRGFYHGASRGQGSIGTLPLPGLTSPTQNARPQLMSRPSISQHGPAPIIPHHGARGSMPPKVPPMTAFISQCELLDAIATEEIPKVEMSQAELLEKDAFRAKLERICQEEISQAFPALSATFNLRAYGSIVSGFATQGSDVDLAIVWSGEAREDPDFKAQLPRVVEHAILKAQHGARLLSRTRVPIIKVCQMPGEELYAALTEERHKWEKLPEEEKYPSLAPEPPTPTEEDHGEPSVARENDQVYDKPQQHLEIDPDVSRSGKKMETAKKVTMNDDPMGFLIQLKSKQRTEDEDLVRYCTQFINARRFALQAFNTDDQTYAEYFLEGLPTSVAQSIIEARAINVKANPATGSISIFEQYYEVAHPIIVKIDAARTKKDKLWLRERALGKLDYPKTGVGIQCDINFSNPLGMHNTELLRLYSLCDPRVRPMILFIKAWAKRRKINSAYMGTLSSYGYVLMVLHFLINIAQPPVLPNLQQVFGASEREVPFQGYNISFYRDEAAIRQMAAQRQWTQNGEPLGVLLRNFYHYYAAQGQHVIGTGFNWMRDVISIRISRGIVSKEWKGWTGAKTVKLDGEREVRQRYLLAIEDPFELDHNVGRPVTHNGIVTIRDEFRRAWRILMAVGRSAQPEGGLFDAVVENATKADDSGGGAAGNTGGDVGGSGMIQGQNSPLVQT